VIALCEIAVSARECVVSARVCVCIARRYEAVNRTVLHMRVCQALLAHERQKKRMYTYLL
jgi:hypothetical protein